MLKPTNSNLVIEVITEEVAMSQGGLFLGNTTQKQPNTGKIVEVSDGSPYIIGQTVMFMKNAGTSFKLDYLDKQAPEYKVIKEEFILGIWE